MDFEEHFKHLPLDIRCALFREWTMMQGRHDAFVFVQACKGELTRIKEELAWYEALIANPPDHWKGPLSPNSSVRHHQDGYRAGLRDALTILTQPTNGSQPAAGEPTPTAPTQSHAETTGAQNELRAEHEESATPAVTAPSAALAPPSE